MEQKRLTKALAVSCGAAAAGLSGWILWGNRALTTTHITVADSRVPAGFDRFRIAHLSDLHNAEFGKNNRRLLKLLEDISPDIIVITGDLADARRIDLKVGLELVKEAVKLAPVYYVPGNHEARMDCYHQLRVGLIDAGAVVLEDRTVTLTRVGDTVTLAGLADPFFTVKRSFFRLTPAFVRWKLRRLLPREEGYRILLSHRPELLPDYARCGADLVFSGHAHGGQARFPLIGGIIAPNQGFFPKYTAGLYTLDNCSMVVSRGLGNSLCPLRFNNPPEVVVAELRREN